MHLFTKAPLILRQVSHLPKRCIHSQNGLQFFRRSWDPFREFSAALREVEHEMNHALIRPFGWPRFHPWIWQAKEVPVETSVNGSRMFRLELDVSKFKGEEIKVKIQDHLLTVEANKNQENKDGSRLSAEYRYQYELPDEVDPEKVRSLLSEDGTLTLEAPLPEIKPPEQKEIPIEKLSSEK